MTGYYERVGDHAFLPTAYAGGAWSPDEVHFAPLGGLLVHEIDRHRAATGSPDLSLGRVAFDILGFLATDECRVEVRTVRPGRTIELVEATAIIRDRPAAVARAWFLADFDTGAVAGGQVPTLAGPDTVGRWRMEDRWTGGFVNSLDVRALDEPQPGRATAWLSSPHGVVAGEQASPHASFLRLVDTANGIAVREKPTAWAFPNVDLTIHLYRRPEGEWTGLDTTQIFGAQGHGLTATVLHDAHGAVGVAHQLLTIRPLPSG